MANNADVTKLAQILACATSEIMAVRHASSIRRLRAELKVRIRVGAWATYHLPPQKKATKKDPAKLHVIQFGTRCVESFFDKDRLQETVQDYPEIRIYGVLPKYGPLTSAVALSFLVLHEFSHFLTYLDGHHREGHGPIFQKKLQTLHEADDGVLVAAFLRSEASRLEINLDGFFVPIPKAAKFAKGDRVKWTGKNESFFGVVLRVNKKSITVHPDDANWRAYVPPSQLQRIE